ncbi:MAG: hypothetical protein WBL21_11210 [Salinimicrobium sp.]
MVRKISISILFSFLLVLFSCSKDEDQKESDKALLTGSWKVKATKVYTLIEGEPEDVKEDIYDTAPYNILTLEADGSAYYEIPEYEGKFNGTWILEENTFYTDVRMEPGVVSSVPLYFFPEGEILELTASHFSYKSIQLYTIRNGEKYSYYVETYFEK